MTKTDDTAHLEPRLIAARERLRIAERAHEGINSDTSPADEAAIWRELDEAREALDMIEEGDDT